MSPNKPFLAHVAFISHLVIPTTKITNTDFHYVSCCQKGALTFIFQRVTACHGHIQAQNFMLMTNRRPVMVSSKKNFWEIGSHNLAGRDKNSPDWVQTVHNLLPADKRRVPSPSPQLVSSWCTQDGHGSHFNTGIHSDEQCPHLMVKALDDAQSYVVSCFQQSRIALKIIYSSISQLPVMCDLNFSTLDIKRQRNKFTSDLSEPAPHGGYCFHSFFSFNPAMME